MKLPVVELPRTVAVPHQRSPQINIPQTRAEREQIRSWIADYVESVEPTPPLSVDELRTHTEAALREHAVDAEYLDYAAVLLNNESWHEQLARVPYDRRLLLLPKCLRIEDRCPAPFDEYGLLCKQCGLCTIQDLQEEAERLGYAVLVAEGSAIVMAIIETGKIDAIVGVSCLSVLERAFPYMETAAIPGVAVPLLQDDCKDTGVDLEWVWDVIHLTSDDKSRRMDLDALRRKVEGWFTPESLASILGPAAGETEALAQSWLAQAGKRWRPFLAICVYQALQEDPEAPLPEELCHLAVAVECFHKASLIHDDIEDGDSRRYGEATLHEAVGVAVALNVGDLLLGEGYRLLAESGAPDAVRARMLHIAAVGHRTLCLGQGAELGWARRPEALASRQVLEIFRQKTAPAFEVALALGAAYAGADETLGPILQRYSEALGIAYQIRDDLEDLEAEGEAPSDLGAQRPTLPLALALERAKGDGRAFMEEAWKRGFVLDDDGQRRLRLLIEELGARERGRELLEAYKEEAVRSLVALSNPSLKGLLRRVIGKIFALEIQGWCSEFEARNAAGGAPRAQAAG